MTVRKRTRSCRMARSSIARSGTGGFSYGGHRPPSHMNGWWAVPTLYRLRQRVDHPLLLRRVEAAHPGHALARHLVEAVNGPVRRLEADQRGGLAHRDDALVVLEDRGAAEVRVGRVPRADEQEVLGESDRRQRLLRVYLRHGR